jgi:hypothetical protein
MRAIFLAAGPAFQSHRVLPPFPNVDLYSLLARLLNLTPAPNDGSVKVFRSVLRDDFQPAAASPTAAHPAAVWRASPRLRDVMATHNSQLTQPTTNQLQCPD